jgi:hypothetical protein
MLVKSASLSWDPRKISLSSFLELLFRHLPVCYCGAAALMRGRSEFRGTRDQMSSSPILFFPSPKGQVPVFICPVILPGIGSVQSQFLFI